MEDKLLGLYNDFKSAGLFTNTKDYDTFKKRMQGRGYQSQIYKVAKQNGADVGQFWQFQRNFGLGRWSGNTNQPAQTSKPLTTSQMAKQIGEQYKKTIQQRSAAYNTGANFAKSQKENQENPIGELASEAWEGVKNIGRSVGNYLGNIGQGMQTTTGGAAPARPYAQPSEYHPKPSKETQQIVKKWGTLTKKDSELSPSERIQANNIRSRIQNAQQQEYNQKNTNPISESRITPNAKNENEVALNLSTDAARQARVKQQHEDDLNQMAYQGVGQNLGKDIFDMTDKAISMAEQASKDFFKGAEDATSFWNQYNPILQKKIADEADRRKSTEFIQQGLQIGLSNKVQDYFSRPEIQKYVVDMADKMNISVEDAVQRYFMPNLMRYGQEAVSQRQLEKVLPQGFWDYLGKNLSNSISGMIVSNAVYSKEERQRRQQALAISEGIEEMPQMVGHNSDYYKAGVLSRAVGAGVNMFVDSPFFGVGGTAADFAVNTGTRLLTRGLERVGLVKLGAKLTPKELAFKAANMSTEQKIMSGLFTNTAKSSLNLGGYSGLTGALQQISTGDDSSAAAVAAAAIEGGWHGMKTGAMFGFSGSITHPWASRYGITGLETSQRQRMLHGAQKLGAHAASLGVEAGTMMVADHLQDGKEISVAQWLEDGVMVMSFKLGDPKVYKHIGSTLHGLVHNTSNTPITLTKDERNELVNSVSGKNLMDAFVSVNAKEKGIRDKNGNLTLDKHIAESLYKDFMADPEVSRSTKEKVNAALGIPSQNYKISQRSVNDVKNKQILEYANDGTLLTRTSYKNAEERRDILYRQKVGRENMNIFNLVGIAKMRGVRMTDEDGNVKDITIDFLKSHGYDISKDATDPKNAKLVADMKNVNNPLYGKWIMFSNKHADELYGLTDEIKGILKKDPLKRTDEEVKVLKDYSTKLESMLYPENEPHGEQSFVQGRNVVQDNNLGTEQPNGEAVKAELNGLKQAEDEMDALIRDNDVFNQNFQKLKQQGLTNPQIYDWMVQQGGLTVEQLEPFAHYINANARVQGMQEATKNAIEQHVSSYVQDWTFHGTLNGQEAKGEQAIFVQDRDGRTLILGSGEIAFEYSTSGRAKEGVGDMIVCLDPNTNEMVYLKTDDVTLSQTQDAENFGNEYRQKLQMINSKPYNEAAQEQAMQDETSNGERGAKNEASSTDAASANVTTSKNPISGEQSGSASNPNDVSGSKGTENNPAVQVNPELYKVANSLQGKVGQSLTKEEADGLVSEMENRAEPARELELTPENWTAEFGEDGKVTTPLGEVKMGENQYFKLAKEGRNGKLGLIKPTLENPDVIIEDASQAKEGQVTERHSSYLFVKAFTGKDGNRVYYFTSVTVSRDGKEVVVSNQERRAKRIATVMESGKILYLKGNQSASVAQNEKPVSLGDSNSPTTTGSQGALHGINSPDLHGKDTYNSSNGNGSEATLTFGNGEKVPVDANGEPDFLKMTPEQGAEVYKMLFEEDAEKQIDSDIKTLEKDLKKVQNTKYDGASVMERAEARKKAKEAIAIAEAQVEKAKAIKKAMTAKKVAESVSKPAENAEGSNEASSEVAKKFQNAPRMQGNSVSKRLPDGTKLKGHYEIVPAESLTPSHDAMNGYKKTEGFPVDENGHTVNDRDYENDKAAQQVTDQMAQNYSGQAITQVPTVSDEGIVYDGNGRTMAGQKAAKNGTDAEYIEDLLDNAQNYGFTREQIEKSGIEHPRLVMVTDERLPYDTATFSKFNRNEKKTQSNTEQAVAKAKTLTSDEVGAIVAEIEGNGTLDAFFNNSKTINDLVKTLVDKGIIGQNEVSGMMDSPERLSAQGREYVKNLLLGSIFKPETIRMLGIEPTLKNKAINAIRSVMDNMKLGDFSLRDEIDQAIQLLYEARRGGNKVDTLLRTPDMFGEDAAKRYPSISQMMALALEGKVSDFRDLLDEYNRIAASRNTGEGNVFGDAPTKEELVNEFLNFKKWQDYGTRHSENEGINDVSGTEKPQQEASGGNGSAGEGTEPERPRVEEPDDLVNKELESRIKVTDEETETPSENGPITRQKILIDGDKEVIKVDEPNGKGEYTGSYYDYDGKKFGDLNEVVEYIDGKAKEEPLPLLPNNEKPDPKFNPIEAAVNEFKKEHPLTEDEITNSDLDDLSKDMALDFLNGEVTDDLHRAIYESIYAKRKGLKVETPKAEPSADPMKSFKNAAEGFEKEKKAKAEQPKKPQQTADDEAVAASNKKVNDLWDMLKNAGKDEMSASFVGLNSRQLEVLPKLVSAMAENAYLRIKRGMRNLEDVVKEMRKEFAPAAKIFKKEDVDTIYEQMMNIRYRDGEQRMSLKEWADYYEKTSPKHQKNLVGDSKTAEERKQAEKKFIDAVKLQLAFGRKFKSIVELRKFAERHGLKDIKDTDLQELAETAIVQRARSIAASEATDNAGKFKRILNLYENQPSLNQRDSERVMKQQYSTPAPYAFLADMYVKGNGKEIKSALEPSAGNGMLTIGLPKDAVHVNDIDAQRLANLRMQGFKNVTSQDGTLPFADKDVDVVVTNPPFGSTTPKEYDGYKISSLEGQMAINALESMKKDGRAAIIIGGKTEYAKNGSLNPKDKAFLGYLYSHYNVEDVINVDGSLYAKQGTSYPTRIILINGRRNYDPEHKVFPPVEKDARAEAVKDYDELYKRIEDDILRERGLQREPLGLSDRERNFDVSGDSLRQKERGGNGVTNNKEHGSGPDGGVSDLGTGGSDERPMGETERTPSEHMGDNSELESGRDSDFGADRGTGSASSRLDNGGRVPEGSVARNANETSNERGAGGDRKQQGGQGRSSSSVQRTVPTREGNGLGVKKEESPKRELSTEKVKYVPQSNNPFSLNSVIPADQARATKKALEKIGDVDNFLVDELGYNDADDMHHALASEQADSVALAIHQAKQGNAFIIGDMTGIGKGRQAAAMIRFAYKQGKIPVFITAKKALFSDMYRDLKSIGNSDLRPFIWAAKDKEHSADMTDSEGKLVYQLPSDKEQERVMDYLQKNGKLPDGYDYIVTTYDSFSSGTMDYEDGKKTVRKNGKGSKNGQRKRDVLEAIAKNANVIMDESHKAGGQGSGSAYLQYVVPKLNAITFLSATYAKRPDNMPIYALRTSMNQAGMKPSELIDAIKRGGATLQEVMSQALTASGQFIRRERDMTGVTIDWKTIDDPVVVEEQREQYDSIISLFNDIIHFQRTYVGAYLDKRNDELAAIQASIKNRQGTKDLGIHNQPFASRTYNMVQQVLLSLKAREAAKSAIEHLKNGEKVVIALNNTNESQTEQYEANAEMEAPDLGVVLMKGLQGVLRYDQTDDMGNKTFGTFNLEDLGPDAVARYHEIEENIKNASTGLSLSPIDVVRDELEAAGYRVGELTGRKTMFVKNPNGTVSKVKRTDTDKKKLALDFNTNKIDALILNRSASTGISLHDSVEYDVEHKPRTMIVVQQQPDVNEEVQMRGRIDRTGQVNRGRYEYIVSQIPSEQRLLMMFKAKLKSLDANTTSSQKSKFNDMEVSDIINKYGDKVVREYMAEHLDLYSKMADPFGWESSFGEDLSTIDPQRLIVTSGGKLGGKEAGADASKLLGRMALLRVSEQEKMLQEIGELYANEIQRLNEMGENDLEITELPLKAKTIHKEVWKQGAEPGGDNAFADNTYIEKVNMAILKKPMKASEVKASQEGLTGGKTWEEYKAEKKAAVKEYFDQKIADETQKYEERAVKAATKAKEKYIKDGKKGQKDSGMSDEKIEKMAGYQYDNIYKQEKDKLNDVVKNLNAKAEMFERVLDTFDTNQTFVLPTDMNNPNELSGFGNSYGRLIDIKITDNYSPNASSVSFATLDGRRKITFPIAGKVGSGENKVDIIGSIDRMTKQAAGMGDNHIKVLNQNLNNWDRLTSNESRKDGYIVTGNLMQALVDSKDQGLGGQLVKYTTDTGEVKTGILMPDRFDPKGLTTDAPINSVADKFELSSWHGGIDEVTSSDGEVKVKRIDNNRGNFYELRVPKSKAKGGKYFLDNDLLKLVNGNNFETRGNNMLAEFKPEQLKPVLDRLSKMGVKVQEERKTSEEEGTHFREEDPQEIELPKDEYAVLAHTIDSSHKNYKRGKVNYEYTADNFYVFKYNKYNDYNVYQKIPIDGNEELINYIKNGINKETIRNPRDIDSALEAGWDGRNGHYWDSTSNQEGRGGSVRPGEVSSLRSRNGRPSDERMGEELSDSPSSAVNNHIERIAKKTGAKVSMVSSVDEITNKAAKAAIEEGRKITGWYDEKTGEVHLYMPNIHDRYTAEKTIWHEVVGHKGMRELFGEDRFEKFLRDVWYDLDKPENAALKKLVDEERKFNPLNIYDAIEEGIARLAEDGKGEVGFWNGIKNKVSDFLHEIGYRIAPNTKDVKYLLWLSKNLQKNPNDPYWKLRAEAVKYRLDHERMPAVVAHDGMFYGNDGKVHSMESLTKSEWDEATDGQIHFHTTPTAATALDRYHRSLDAHGYMATESYMDNMLSLKKLMNAIVPDKKIEDIASSENPYILQNTMQGAMSDAAKLFEINIMKPLEKSMAGILDAFDGKNSDEKIRNFNLYMITKHGLERNREFFVRDFLKQMRMDEQKKQDADFLENSYYSDKEYLDNELKAGNIDLKEYYRQLDESIRNHFDADFETGEHDYSGMHAIQEVAKSSDPYDDAEAIQSVMDSEAKMESIKKGAVKDYWDKVKAATQYSVDSDYKNGIISKELHGHVSNMFNWYVPLRKYDEATAEDTYGYITEKGDPKSYIGSTIMRARGHKYLSETNILAQIGAMGNRAISNGGQNAIRQAFARFARNNSGNNLITETSVWYEKDPVVNIVYERYPDIPDGATADEINQIVSDFNKDMKMKESQGMAYKVYRRDKIGYKFQRAENKSQHIVDVMIAGKKHSFVINGNPRAAQALNGMLEHKVGTFGKPFSVISRYMAQTCTSYNPEFVMRNMIRDFEFASTNLLAKEGMAYTKTFEKYYAQVGLIEGIRNTKLSDLKKMTGFGLFSKYRNGTLDTSDKIQRYFKEFMENGGETGWVQVKNTKELTAEYKLHIKTERNKVRKVSKGIFDAIFKNLENVNEVAENLARFATYCASRDAGRSAVRSAYDAKEVSTNFNRHGSGSEIKSFKNGEMSGFDNARKQAYRFTSAWFRNTSMFFNAGIQSTNLLIKNFKNNKAGTIGYIMAGPMISGMAMALLNNFLIANEDEKDRKGVKDPYGELPDYIRRNNLCIYVGGGDFVTIPLAIEERAFYGLGDLAAGLTFSKNISGQKNPALDAVGCISQLAPVTDYLGNASFGKNPGEETLKAVLPSATSPFLEWAFNSDWKGAPIHRENKFDEYQPSWMLAYQGTPEWLINMNKKVNAMTNDVAPGNENMLGNGFLDAVTDPSGLQHFYSGYLGGAATFMERLGGIFKNGKDTETKDIPFVRSLFYTPSEKTSLQRTKSKWYNYLDETEKMIANAKRLKSKNVPLDELVKNYGDYYKFKQSKGAEKMNVIETAIKEMKKWKKLRDKSSDTESIKFANQNIDNIMMKAVDELDKLN